MDLLFFQMAIALYVCAAVAYLVFLILPEGKRVNVAFGLMLAGFITHILSIFHRALFSGYFPLTTLFDAVSLFSLLIVGAFLIFRYHEPSPIFGAITAPLAAVLMIFGTTLSYQIQQPVVPILRSWWLPIHVLLALIGNGIFASMAIAGLMYMIQERLIKSKKIGRLYRMLPSLETLDAINRRGLPLGFFFLTLGIISGALWAGSAWGSYWSWDPKETWSLITWFVYAAMVHQRLVLGWRGRKAAIFAIAGFVLVMFTFVGVSAFLGGYHSFSGVESFRGMPRL